jgi:hypothetical protein
MNPATKQLSDEMRTAAVLLLRVRSRLASIIAEFGFPAGGIPADYTRVMCDGLSVAHALGRLAEAEGERP